MCCATLEWFSEVNLSKTGCDYNQIYRCHSLAFPTSIPWKEKAKTRSGKFVILN